MEEAKKVRTVSEEEYRYLERIKKPIHWQMNWLKLLILYLRIKKRRLSNGRCYLARWIFLRFFVFGNGDSKNRGFGIDVALMR